MRDLCKYALGAGVLSMSLLATGAQAQTQNISDLFNTGVDNSGTPLVDDVDDTHYSIIVDPSGLGDSTVEVDGFPIPPWLANDANSRWIGPNNAEDANDANGPAGAYTYRTTFTLPANADLTSVSITGNWATDDGGTSIAVNGTNTNNAPAAGFGSFTAFTINDGNADFVVGSNTIDFSLGNGGGPTGLRVDDMVGTFALIPEPASLSLLALGGPGLLARRRRGA